MPPTAYQQLFARSGADLTGQEVRVLENIRIIFSTLHDISVSFNIHFKITLNNLFFSCVQVEVSYQEDMFFKATKTSVHFSKFENENITVKCEGKSPPSPSSEILLSIIYNMSPTTRPGRTQLAICRNPVYINIRRFILENN